MAGGQGVTTILNDKTKLHHVLLPDGRLVRHVRRTELLALFKQWRIPNVTDDQSKDDMAAAYFAHLGVVAKDVEANAGPMRETFHGRSLRDGSGAMSPQLMAMAADVIARQKHPGAAPASRPSRSIASMI